MKYDLQQQAGVILKKIPYSDSDEIISVLLKDHGLQRFFVAGSRKSKKRYQGLIDHFAHLNFSFKPSEKGLWRVREVDLARKQSYLAWQDVMNFAFGNFLAELICEMLPEGAHDHDLYDLWDHLEAHLHRVDLTLFVAVEYLVQVFKKTGYEIDFSSCVSCRQGLDGTVVFDYIRGGFTCSDCSYDQRQGLSKALMTSFQKGENHQIPAAELEIFFRQLIQFSQNILQKPSQSAPFLLDMMI